MGNHFTTVTPILHTRASMKVCLEESRNLLRFLIFLFTELEWRMHDRGFTRIGGTWMPALISTEESRRGMHFLVVDITG
jgi:hypothetical protein